MTLTNNFTCIGLWFFSWIDNHGAPCDFISHWDGFSGRGRRAKEWNGTMFYCLVFSAQGCSIFGDWGRIWSMRYKRNSKRGCIRGVDILNWYERGLCFDCTRILWIPSCDWPRKKSLFFVSRPAAWLFKVGIMDLNQQKEPDPEERQFYPVPHSHWFPRPIAFRVYTSSGGKSQHDCGSKGARRLHIQVSRPVSFDLTSISHCWCLVIKQNQSDIMLPASEILVSPVTTLSRSANLFGAFWGALYCDVQNDLTCSSCMSYQRRFCCLQLPVRLTKEIVDTYHACNPSFQYTESCNPKRFLTVPSVGVSNNGSDNENHDLILYFGRILANDDNTRRYGFSFKVALDLCNGIYTFWVLGASSCCFQGQMTSYWMRDCERPAKYGDASLIDEVCFFLTSDYIHSSLHPLSWFLLQDFIFVEGKSLCRLQICCERSCRVRHVWPSGEVLNLGD